jgi:hypothetical protein
MTELLLSALAGLGLGGLSSGHCALMCGGLVSGLSLCSARHSTSLWVGRALSYSALGAAAGSLLAYFPSQSSGASSAIRVLFAAALIAAVLAIRSPPAWLKQSPLSLVWQPLAPYAKGAAAIPTPAARFSLGLMWGLLPCAALHTLLITAASSGSPANGAALMLGFAAGTSPALWWLEKRLFLKRLPALWLALALVPLPLLVGAPGLRWLHDCFGG